MTENEAKKIAFFHLNRSFRILMPAAEATVTFPEFNPFRAANIIARVDWPAIVAFRSVTCTHFICDGDAVV